MSWACPRCDRTFRQVNQRHACGVGSAATLLKSRPPALTDLYRKRETTVRGFGDVEVVTRNRYALFRTTRIFADLTVMREASRGDSPQSLGQRTVLHQNHAGWQPRLTRRPCPDRRGPRHDHSVFA